MPTPGASSASVNDKAANSFLDNNDGTFSNVTVPASAARGYASVSNAASTAAAPAAGTTIATLTTSAAGYYQIDVTYGYGATAEATTADNFALNINAVNVGTLTAPVGVANTLEPKQTFYAQVGNGQVVKLVTGAAAGSAGAIYKGMIVLTRLA